MVKVVEILDQIENEQGGNTSDYTNDKSHISFWKMIREQRQNNKPNNYTDKSDKVAKKVTKMEINTKVDIRMVRNMDKALTLMQMEKNTWVNL
jgi:hypothetical protein